MRKDELKARFYKEVFMASAEAVLPCNLSDEWLELLLLQAQFMNDEKDSDHFSLLVSAVLKILFNRSETGELALMESELFKYLESYSMELSLEKINRATDMKASSATLETILTDRVIEVTTT